MKSLPSYSDLFKTIALSIIMLCVFESQAQQVFSGSFLMSVKSPSMNSDDPPMLWNIERASSGEKMAMELQDEMRKKE